MAKKASTLSEKKIKGSVFDLVNKIDNSTEIIEESVYSKIKEWIPTGNYMLNACISGDLFKGVPTGRVTTFVGEEGTGKTYLSCSICREAQKMGYTPVYLDSEGAMDATFVKRLGVDTTNFIIKQVNTISEISHFIAKLCKELDAQETNYGYHQKVILVLDSLGNLASEKEITDTVADANKKDLTKQQDVKSLFRVNATPIARLDIPFIVVSHVYDSMNMFKPGKIVSGGSGIKYNSSVIIELSNAKLADKDNDSAASKKVGQDNVVKNGVLVTAKPQKSRFCIPTKIKFQIPYYKKPNIYVGLENYLTWENAGVVRGKCLNEKEYTKLTPSEQLKCFKFDYNGETLYALPQETTGRGIVVKHLGRQVSFVEFFTDTVFTPEFLEHINETIIKPLFQLPDQSSYDDIKELEDSLNADKNEQDDDSENE